MWWAEISDIENIFLFRGSVDPSMNEGDMPLTAEVNPFVREITPLVNGNDTFGPNGDLALFLGSVPSVANIRGRTFISI